MNCVKSLNTCVWKVVCLFELSGLDLKSYIKLECLSMNLRFGDWTEMKNALTLKPLKFTGFLKICRSTFFTPSVICNMLRTGLLEIRI